MKRFVPFILVTLIALASPAFATQVNLTAIPFGPYEYCQRNPTDTLCGATHAVVKMPDNSRGAVEEINQRINLSIRYVDDWTKWHKADYWEDIPPEGVKTGDCDEYALEKAKALQAAGWPLGSFDFLIARQNNGDYHVVLVAHLKSEDFIMDTILLRWVNYSDKKIKMSSGSLMTWSEAKSDFEGN